MKEKKYGETGYVNEIDADDRKLFDAIFRTSPSENEKHFFRIAEYRQKHNLSTGSDLLLSYEENPDGIGFYRFLYDWYMIQIDDRICPAEYRSEHPDIIEIECSSLSGMLECDIEEYISEKTGCRTMLEYLRSIDYNGINYERDSD